MNKELLLVLWIVIFMIVLAISIWLILSHDPIKSILGAFLFGLDLSLSEVVFKQIEHKN